MNLYFEPVIWKEHKYSNESETYRRCEVCTNKSRIIWGEGNPDASVFVILDNPGAREDKDGNEYVCPTRQTLQTALHNVSLKEEDIYLTYLLKCRPLRKYDKERARVFSKPFLIDQIERMQPKFIVCLGDVVTRTIFNDQEVSVKDLRGLWHTFIGYSCMVSYHPLAVRRRPNLMGRFIEDWDMLAKELRHRR